MIKRALAVTICLMMALVLLPAKALADPENFTLYFHDGKLYTDSDYKNLYPTDTTWRGDGNKLYLTNFHFITLAMMALRLPDGTELVLEGTNTVKSTFTHVESYGVFCEGTLSIQGPGTLTATGGDASLFSCGVFAKQAITVKSGSIIGNGGYTVNGSDTPTDALEMSCGVCTNNITANGGSITGTGGTTNERSSYGVYAKQNITVNSGSITGTGGSATKWSSYGVYADSNITVNGGSITGTGGTAGGTSGGVTAAYFDIAVNGGSIKGVGNQGNSSIGINANNLAVNSGRLVGEALSSATEKSALSRSHSKGLPSTYYWRTEENDDYTKSSVAVFPYSEEYTYVDISSGPRIAVSVPAFGTGQAPQNEKITVEVDEDFRATENFDSATMDDAPLDLGAVGSSGAHGSVSNGSIVIQLNKAYLDTLPVGTHTLRVNLAGAYAGQYVETRITVLPSGDGDAGADVPKTGDSATPMLWVGIALLASVGLAVSVFSRRKRQNG